MSINRTEYMDCRKWSLYNKLSWKNWITIYKNVFITLKIMSTFLHTHIKVKMYIFFLYCSTYKVL